MVQPSWLSLFSHARSHALTHVTPTPTPARRILTIQFFECLNVATQALCSSYLGSGDIVRARSVMLRLATLGTCIGGVVGLVVFGLQESLAGFFTKDRAVIAQVREG